LKRSKSVNFTPMTPGISSSRSISSSVRTPGEIAG